MSRHQPLFPTEITLDTLPQLFAAHRAMFGGMRMEDAPPERPDDISEEEWDALGDPGKQALARLRNDVTTLRSQLAAAKARPGPAKQATQEPGTATQQATQQANGGDQPDIGKLVSEAVASALKPFQEREQQREASDAAKKVADAVVAAADGIYHDKTDALQIDLAAVVDDDGVADSTKIQAALKAHLEAKPHLAKTDGRRYAPGDSLAGPSATQVPLADRVKAELAVMQSTTGIRPPATT